MQGLIRAATRVTRPLSQSYRACLRDIIGDGRSPSSHVPRKHVAGDNKPHDHKIECVKSAKLVSKWCGTHPIAVTGSLLSRSAQHVLLRSYWYLPMTCILNISNSTEGWWIYYWPFYSWRGRGREHREVACGAEVACGENVIGSLSWPVSRIGPSCQSKHRPRQAKTGQDSRRCVVSLVNVVSIGGLRPDDTPSDCLRLVLRGVMCCPDLEMNKCRRLPAQTFAAEPESKLTPAFGTLTTYDHLNHLSRLSGPH